MKHRALESLPFFLVLGQFPDCHLGEWGRSPWERPQSHLPLVMETHHAGPLGLRWGPEPPHTVPSHCPCRPDTWTSSGPRPHDTGGGTLSQAPPEPRDAAAPKRRATVLRARKPTLSTHKSGFTVKKKKKPVVVFAENGKKRKRLIQLCAYICIKKLWTDT